MTPLERATQAIQSITVFWDETYDGAFVVTGDPTRYATNAEAQKAQARAQARAVIAAIREPSKRMVAEGESAASYGIGKPTHEGAVEKVWQDMIDAALAEASCTAAS